MLRFLEMQGPNCRETLHHPLPKATLVCKKKKEEKSEKAHLHQRNQVFPISIMETLLHWVPLSGWPVWDEFRLVWECGVCVFQTESSDLNVPVK